MALPKLTTPTYELEIPSTDEKIKYRPFLVREEKILMMAMESKKNADIVQAVKDIVSECTFNKVNMSDLPMFDVEYIFLQIRSKSVGEVSKIKVLCPDDGKTSVPVNINLDDIVVQKSEKHTNQIKLDTKIMMEMKYPSLDEFIKNNFDFNDTNQMDQSFKLIASCIDKIYTEDDVWASEDCTKKEMNDFLESMNSQQFKEIEAFFTTMPKLSHTIKVKNPETKVESDVVLEGLASFFG